MGTNIRYRTRITQMTRIYYLCKFASFASFAFLFDNLLILHDFRRFSRDADEIDAGGQI